MGWFDGLLGRNQKGTISENPSTTRARPGEPLGPFTNAINGHVFREVDPRLYEAMREACPHVDGAINTTIMLDGIVDVEAENDRLEGIIRDWMDNVPVGDFDHGIQTFFAQQGNEAYEQGFSLGEMVMRDDGRDVERLRVADSKGIHFRRDRETGQLEIWYSPQRHKNTRQDGTENIERVLRNSYAQSDVADWLNRGGYRKLTNSENLLYFAFSPEADNPYGVSLMRSTEFDVRVLLTIKNALRQTWERFGDPVFHVNYKTKNRKVNQEDLKKRKKALADDIAEAWESKRKGNSVDFVTAVGADDTLEVTVVGHDNQVLEVEMPARHVLEGFVAKAGVPPWMIGLIWGTAERLAQRQADRALHDSKTRFKRRLPGLNKAVATMLRARGITWNPGDWRLVQDLPSLQDQVAQAQAEFLREQAAAMREQRTTNPSGDNEPADA